MVKCTFCRFFAMVLYGSKQPPLSSLSHWRCGFWQVFNVPNLSEHVQCTAFWALALRQRPRQGRFSLWRRGNARNVRLYYPYRQYTDLFIFRFVFQHCLRSTLRLYIQCLFNIYTIMTFSELHAAELPQLREI